MMLNKIRELTQPSPNASFIHAHSIPRAAAGIKEAASPIIKQTVISHDSLKIKAMASKPVTITRMVL